MIAQIISTILIGILCLIPIVIWAYFFSYFDNNNFNSRRFLVGIISGSISVVPVLYFEEILGYFNLGNFNLIAIISDKTSSSINFFIGTILVLTFIFSIIFLSNFIFTQEIKKTLKNFLKSIGTFSIFLVIYLAIFSIIRNIDFLDFSVNSPINIGKNIIVSFAGIIIYYFLVGLLEESSKHFSFLSSGSENNSITTGIIYAVIIALGFGFIENILYISGIYSNSGVGKEVFSVWFFRSIFSLFVHILCSFIVAYYFLKGYFGVQKSRGLFFYKTFLFGIIFSILIHAIYDISLTLNFTLIIFVYFIFGYMFMTKILYKK